MRADFHLHNYIAFWAHAIAYAHYYNFNKNLFFWGKLLHAMNLSFNVACPSTNLFHISFAQLEEKIFVCLELLLFSTLFEKKKLFRHTENIKFNDVRGILFPMTCCRQILIIFNINSRYIAKWSYFLECICESN